jgi:hypothetical protein
MTDWGYIDSLEELLWLFFSPFVMKAKKFPQGKNETLCNIKTISKIL